MSREYTWTEAERETGLSRFRLARCLKDCAIVPQVSRNDSRKLALTSQELEAVRDKARELWPADASPHTAVPPDLSAVLGRLDTLERRVRALETRQHASALPSLALSPLPRETPPARSYVRASLDADTGEMFPQSLRGKGEWVELHGGPGRHYVREWPEARGWQSAADAIAGVRARGWPDFMRGADNATPQPSEHG